MNANMIESEMLTSTLEREMRKLIIRAQKEVLEVCAKEYNFDINAAMLLVNAGGERKKPTASGIAKELVAKDPKAPKEKKERAKKAVKELIEGEVEGDRKRNCSKGRPKNPDKVVEVEATENLFEQLVNTQLEQVEEDVSCCVVFQTKEEKKTEESAEKVERGLMSVEEKETKVVNKAEAKEAEKLAKLEEKATASANAKLAKEAEKASAIANAKLAKEAEKATAIANAKLAKLAATASAIAAKEQEKLAKEAEKAEKATASAIAKLAKASAKATASAIASGSDSDTSSKSVKKATSKKTKETAERVAKEANDVEYQAKMTELSEKLEAAPGHKLVIPVVAVVAVVEVVATASSVVAASAPATLKVKSFKYEGVTYFREKTTGAIYDKETNDHLGQWNEATQKIEFLEPEEELEEEEESAGESSDEEEEEEESA
jgi:hypothetical protein